MHRKADTNTSHGKNSPGGKVVKWLWKGRIINDKILPQIAWG